MASITAGPFLVAAGLLVVSGASKLAAPDGVASALATLGREVPRAVGRALGGLEMAIGAAAIGVAGPRPAVVVGATYLGFAVVVVMLRRRGGTSCGCFGAVASPPSRVHLALDLVAGAVAIAHAAGGGLPAVFGSAAGSPGGPVVFAGLVVLGVAAAAAALTVLPGTLAQAATVAAAAADRHDRHRDRGVTLQLSPRRT